MSDIKEKTCVMKYFLTSIIYHEERLEFFKYQTNLQAITNNNTSIILSHYITSQQCIKIKYEPSLFSAPFGEGCLVTDRNLRLWMDAKWNLRR